MITDLHRSLSPTDTLLSARRALYRMAVDFLAQPRHRDALSGSAGAALLDSPFLHRAVLDAMVGDDAMLSDHDLERANRIAARAVHVVAGGCDIPVLAEPDADSVLDDVLRMLDGDSGSHAQFLTPRDEERFLAGLHMVQEGLDLATATVPTLLRDLLPHVCMIAMLDGAGTNAVHSASLREYPGLIITGGPGTALEAAEMIIHEAAHQKLFDMALVLDVLRPESDTAPAFAPPWRAPAVTWPLEQALAAFHAYSCLAEFADALDAAHPPSELHAASLLPEARRRSVLIGSWLVAQSPYLGLDARAVVGGLLAVEVSQGHASAPRPLVGATAVTVDPNLRVDVLAAPGPVLVGRSARPPDFYFLGPDSGRVLELLRGRQPVDSAISTFARERGLGRSDAHAVVTSILSDLAALDLISVTDTIR